MRAAELKTQQTQDYNDEDEDGEEWAEDNELSGLTHGRLQAIKMCRWRCLNLANGPRGDNANAQVSKVCISKSTD